MKAYNKYFEATGNEIDDVVRYPLSEECDKYLSRRMSRDIKKQKEKIRKCLVFCIRDWVQVPGDYAPDDDVPREMSNFYEFMMGGKELKAREASLILRYSDDVFAEQRAGRIHRIPADFARDIAVASILHTAVNTDAADLVPVVNLSVYREAQRMPDYEAARQAWIGTLYPQQQRKDPLERAYWHELRRKEAEVGAMQSLSNAQMLADTYEFNLADAVKAHLDK